MGSQGLLPGGVLRSPLRSDALETYASPAEFLSAAVPEGDWAPDLIRAFGSAEGVRTRFMNFASSNVPKASLVLCSEGCGYETRLVIDAAGEGSIWMDGRVSDYGMAPCFQAGRPILHSFSSWLLDWCRSADFKPRIPGFVEPEVWDKAW